jgi:hypothetical protein
MQYSNLFLYRNRLERISGFTEDYPEIFWFFYSYNEISYYNDIMKAIYQFRYKV